MAELILNGRFELASSNVLKLRIYDDPNNGALTVMFLFDPAKDKAKLDVLFSRCNASEFVKASVAGSRHYTAGALMGKTLSMLEEQGSVNRTLPSLQSRAGMLPRCFPFSAFVHFVRGIAAGYFMAHAALLYANDTNASFRCCNSVVTIVVTDDDVAVSGPQGAVTRIQTTDGFAFGELSGSIRRIYGWRTSGFSRIERVLEKVARTVLQICRQSTPESQARQSNNNRESTATPLITNGTSRLSRLQT